MLTVRTSENTVITSFRLISERQDFSSVRTVREFNGVIYSGTYWRIFLLDLYILEDCLWNLIAAFRIQFSCS